MRKTDRSCIHTVFFKFNVRYCNGNGNNNGNSFGIDIDIDNNNDMTMVMTFFMQSVSLCFPQPLHPSPWFIRRWLS